MSKRQKRLTKVERELLFKRKQESKILKILSDLISIQNGMASHSNSFQILIGQLRDYLEDEGIINFNVGRR